MFFASWLQTMGDGLLCLLAEIRPGIVSNIYDIICRVIQKENMQ